jgi:hypothetical protein
LSIILYSSPNITLNYYVQDPTSNCSKIQPKCCGKVSSTQSQTSLPIQLCLPKFFFSSPKLVESKMFFKLP